MGCDCPRTIPREKYKTFQPRRDRANSLHRQMALADSFDGFLVDLDGVVWIGREPVTGAVEALRGLIDMGKELVFVTNNPGRPPAAYVERLRGAGVPVAEGRVVTAGVTTARLAADRVGAGAGTFVIGTPGLKEAATEAGLELLVGEAAREADAVLVSGHRDFDYAELLTATMAIRHGAALFATSRDPTLPMPDGPWPGTGAVLAAVETASGKRAEIGGKPEPHLFEQARALIPDAERVAMVGDRIASDIVGAQRAGLVAILVLSGACSRAEADAVNPPPDHVLDDLSGLLG
jgi:glycerol-1-phosphatase